MLSSAGIVLGVQPWFSYQYLDQEKNTQMPLLKMPVWILLQMILVWLILWKISFQEVVVYTNKRKKSHNIGNSVLKFLYR